jgi:hypothetical protein
MMVVPIGGSESFRWLLGCGPAVGPVGWGVVCFTDGAAEADVWLAVGLGAPVTVAAELADGVALPVDPRPVLDVEVPPHAASSSSDPRPAAAAHPLLRITFSFIDGPFPARVRRERQVIAPVTRRRRRWRTA